MKNEQTIENNIEQKFSLFYHIIKYVYLNILGLQRSQSIIR